jgi:glycosyltransferase involved in cell wall biosynthesis
LFAAEYLRWGFQPEFIDTSKKDDLDRAVGFLKRGEVAFCHCEQGRSLSLVFNDAERPRNLFEHFQVPVIGHVRDYPFSAWIYPVLSDLGSTATVFHTDEKAPEMVRALGISNGRHIFAPHVYLDFRQPSEQVLDRAERKTDFLYVGTYRSPLPARTKFHAIYKDWRSVFDSLLDAAVGDFFRPIHEILFDDILPAHKRDRPQPKISVEILHFATDYIRNERRRRLFLKMARYPIHVVWSGPIPEVTGKITALVRPELPLLATLDLMCKSRYMIMTLANYTHSLSERLLSAMARGCVPIVQSNALIDRAFRDGKSIMKLKGDLSNFDEVVQQVQSHDRFYEMSMNGRRRVRQEFSPAARVRQFFTHFEPRVHSRNG